MLAIVIIAIVLVLILSYKNCSCQNNSKTNIKKLIRQTSRWSTAADQDTNPYIANLHSTYALGYLMALRELYSDEEIKNLSDVDVRALEIEITKIMDASIIKLASICPEGQPKNEFLRYLSQQGALR